ncbi:MAG: hypothetical protein AB8F78_19915 [Saprospiraceae bacterium]
MSKDEQQPKRETGWDKLRQENEDKHTFNFKPIRSAIRRNEFVGSIVELFISAVVGVSKYNLGAQEPQKKEETDSLE